MSHFWPLSSPVMMLFNCLRLMDVIIYESEIFHIRWLLTWAKCYQIRNWNYYCLVLFVSVFAVFHNFRFFETPQQFEIFKIWLFEMKWSHRLPGEMLVFIIWKVVWKKTGGKDLVGKRPRGGRTWVEKTGIEKTGGEKTGEEKTGWERLGGKDLAPNIYQLVYQFSFR